MSTLNRAIHGAESVEVGINLFPGENQFPMKGSKVQRKLIAEDGKEQHKQVNSLIMAGGTVDDGQRSGEWRQ